MGMRAREIRLWSSSKREEGGEDEKWMHALNTVTLTRVFLMFSDHNSFFSFFVFPKNRDYEGRWFFSLFEIFFLRLHLSLFLSRYISSVRHRDIRLLVFFFLLLLFSSSLFHEHRRCRWRLLPLPIFLMDFICYSWPSNRDIVKWWQLVFHWQNLWWQFDRINLYDYMILIPSEHYHL